MAENFLNNKIEMHCGDCIAVLPTLPDNSIDSCVTDPPYHLTSIIKRYSNTRSNLEQPPNKNLARVNAGQYRRLAGGFMGKRWDGGDIAFRPEVWVEVYRVLKPGAHLLAFGGTRTYHRMACAIEDAGFEIRDTIMWLYGSGFPKSHNIGNGWGTALKPACEPIVLARKPLSEGTVAANVLKHGVGALNIDGCRISGEAWQAHTATGLGSVKFCTEGETKEILKSPHNLGRWPANLIHDGSEEVVEGFPDTGISSGGGGLKFAKSIFGLEGDGCVTEGGKGFGDSGSAARFFYTAKADSDDRLGSKHPTVKPLDLMQYLARLITPKGGIVLDPFAGTGTTGEAAWREGMKAVLIERESEYQADIRRRMELVLSGPDERTREGIKQRTKDKPRDDGPLFGGTSIGTDISGRKIYGVYADELGKPRD